MEHEKPALQAFYVKKKLLFSAIFVSVIAVGFLILRSIQGINPLDILFSIPFLYFAIRTWRSYFNRKPQLVISENGILIDGKPFIKWEVVVHCYLKENLDVDYDDHGLVVKTANKKNKQVVWLGYLDKEKPEVEEVINHYAGIHGFSTVTPPPKWWQ